MASDKEPGQALMEAWLEAGCPAGKFLKVEP
jgi:hypothetical protein